PADPRQDWSPIGAIDPIPHHEGSGESNVTLLDSTPSGFEAIFMRRRSARIFSGRRVSHATASKLFQIGIGKSGEVSAYGYDQFPLRTYASSGGLQSTNIYIVINKVDGVEPGVYAYNCMNHSL